MGSLPDNLSIIEDIHDENEYELSAGRIIHATNGVYSADPQLIVPTTLAGFRFIEEQKFCGKYNPFLIAVNSDASMRAIMAQKGESGKVESQETRAMKVALPLAQMVGNRSILVTFFDEPTPHELYTLLSEFKLGLESIHKWGFGTKPGEPKIVGAELFKNVYGFPLPNDIKPVAYDITDREDQPSVKVAKLTEQFGKHGTPYLSTDGKILFPVPPELQQYTQVALDEYRQRFITTSTNGLTITHPEPKLP